jgi:PAS domain S-box-containing protein
MTAPHHRLARWLRSQCSNALHGRKRGSAKEVDAVAELERQRFVIDQHAVVIGWNTSGALTYGNQKFIELSGFAPTEFKGKSLALLDSGHHPPSFFREMYATIHSGRVWRAEVCHKAKSGQLFWLDCTVAAFMNADGTPREFVSVSTDITQLKWAKEAANAASRAKSEFLANMSHEIRTPMNGVVGTVDILRTTRLDTTQHRMLGTIHESSLALLRILNDILDFSKIEADKLRVEHIPTHLRDVVEGVAQLMVSLSNRKDIDLLVFVDPAIPAWIYTDPMRLRQVLFNLLGNALKFTVGRPGSRGAVRLLVRPSEALGDVPCLEMAVIDNGIGMSPEELDCIFDAFTQGDLSTARNFGGTGLGLTISRRLVEMMLGRILVQSELGVGSTFTVQLPLAEAPAGQGAVSEPSLDGLNVLLFSQQDEQRRVLSSYLRSAHANVTEVVSPDAVQLYLAASLSADACVLVRDVDVRWDSGALPKAFASKLAGTVQLIHHNESSPFGAAVAVRAQPLLLRELLDGVAVAAGRLDPRQLPIDELRPRHSRPIVPTGDDEPYTGALILLVEDNDTNQEVMQAQLKILGYRCECASDGETALALWRTGKFSLILTDCHMPNMDGFELTTRVRSAEPDGVRIPIIAVTASAMDGEATRCLQRGMDAYITKPLRLHELGGVLDKWLSPQAAVPSESVVWNPKSLTEHVGDNPAIHRRLLDRFQQCIAAQLTELDKFADEGDLANMVALAHKMKSAALTVGAMYLAELCKMMEECGEHDRLAMAQALVPSMHKAFGDVLPYVGRDAALTAA